MYYESLSTDRAIRIIVNYYCLRFVYPGTDHHLDLRERVPPTMPTLPENASVNFYIRGFFWKSAIEAFTIQITEKMESAH